MTSERGSGSNARDPMDAGRQIWEAGYQSLFEGWRQTQEFWNRMGRGWGEVSSAWLQQLNSTAANQGTEVLRELQDAAFEVAQAWLRLPMSLATGASPEELQAAITRLTQAQGRAYQMWLESLGRLGGDAAPAAGQATSADPPKRD